MRLDKLLSHMGYGSRKNVKALIRQGYVSVNGEVVANDDYKVDEKTDEIILFDEAVCYEDEIYLLMNKPQGVLTATRDSSQPTVLDLIDGYDRRNLFPVGRLDKDTTGLLLITNNGKLAHQLLSPKNHVDKTYELTFSGTLCPNYATLFAEGVRLEDDFVCLPATISVEQNRAVITIQEGKYHQIKRMMEAVGGTVLTLKRISFGPLNLPMDLKEGDYRRLTKEEIVALKEC